ncbi:MAG: hypothetical protein OET79_09840, partial [Nitrospirota bacterium]|nr:hypothetical protein [Nitrospirota bacterium]
QIDKTVPPMEPHITTHRHSQKSTGHARWYETINKTAKLIDDKQPSRKLCSCRAREFCNWLNSVELDTDLALQHDGMPLG